MKLFNKKNKPLVVTIHGFGQNRSHELDNLAQYLKEHGYPVVQFDIYSLEDSTDANAKEWLARCEKQMQQAFARSRDVVLVGFSMGGVIAAWLASVYQVQKLVLVAPAFHYLDFEKIAKSVTKSVSRKKDTSVPGSAQTKAFREVVSLCKDSIDHIHCPTLILHGTADEIIDPSSSHDAWKRLGTNTKRLLYLEGAGHKMLYDGQMEKTPFSIILSFLEGNLV